MEGVWRGGGISGYELYFGVHCYHFSLSRFQQQCSLKSTTPFFHLPATIFYSYPQCHLLCWPQHAGVTSSNDANVVFCFAQSAAADGELFYAHSAIRLVRHDELGLPWHGSHGRASATLHAPAAETNLPRCHGWSSADGYAQSACHDGSEHVAPQGHGTPWRGGGRGGPTSEYGKGADADWPPSTPCRTPCHAWTPHGKWWRTKPAAGGTSKHGTSHDTQSPASPCAAQCDGSKVQHYGGSQTPSSMGSQTPSSVGRCCEQHAVG